MKNVNIEVEFLTSIQYAKHFRTSQEILSGTVPFFHFKYSKALSDVIDILGERVRTISARDVRE